MSIFAPKRKNRHIFQGAISLIYWPILTNLGIKLIVSTRQIQWNNLQSNILKNKDFQFFVSFAHKNQFSHNFPSYLSAEKIRKKFFWSFCTDSWLKQSDIEKKIPNHSALVTKRCMSTTSDMMVYDDSPTPGGFNTFSALCSYKIQIWKYTYLNQENIRYLFYFIIN